MKDTENRERKTVRLEIQKLCDFSDFEDWAEHDENAPYSHISYEESQKILPPQYARKPEVLHAATPSPRWRKRPVRPVDASTAGFVRRRDVWRTLQEAGFSMSKAAKILNRGRQFLKWASPTGAPNEIVKVTKDELEILKIGRPIADDCPPEEVRRIASKVKRENDIAEKEAQDRRMAGLNTITIHYDIE